MQAKLLAALLVLTAFPAFAESNETPRYQLISVSGGFVRLDMVTGVMTFCRDEVDSFRCGPIPADADKRAMRPDAGKEEARPEAGIEPREGDRREPGFKEDKSSEDFDRALTMMDKAMRHFMAMSKEKPKDCDL
jgi:hypothetical protein